MIVLVDTSIWSLALRRSRAHNSEAATILQELISESRVRMIGPIRQELLSGISEPKRFETLRAHLSAFPDERITTEDYVRAAELSNHCRRHGVQGSSVDFLICAVAEMRGWDIFTSDNDFINYRKIIPVSLFNSAQA